MATKGDNLQSFKIGDTRKPTVQRRGAQKEESNDSRSLGFARIEKILENENHGSINQKLTGMLDAIADYEQGAAAVKEKAAVKKAVMAVERTAELMTYLFETKAELEEQAQPPASTPSKRSK